MTHKIVITGIIIVIIKSESTDATFRTIGMVISSLNSKSSPNNIYKILPKFTNINVSLGKFVYRHIYSSEVYSYFL
ncbi:hypothetical protein ACMSFP_24750, partial [Bacteroides thetaiotaomicron]|uniref:hypothetical protein n=1 Tax=Bacteroides thetaiotaomicron TaxID=818 RepID=UPI0039C23F7B